MNWEHAKYESNSCSILLQDHQQVLRMFSTIWRRDQSLEVSDHSVMLAALK